MVEASQLLQFIANGVVFGSILALAAIGLSLVYGILNLSNFAHGDFVTLGVFLAFLFAILFRGQITEVGLILPALLLVGLAVDAGWTKRVTRGEQLAVGIFAVLLGLLAAWVHFGGPGGAGTTNRMLVLSTMLSVAFTVLFLIGLEFLVWRPLRRRRATVLTLIIVSIGLALIIRNALQLYFGGGLRQFARPTPVSDIILGVQISDAQQFTLVASIVVIALLHLFLKYTRTGKAMRALSDNMELARVTGIDVDRSIVYVWAITGLLVSIAGVLLALVLNNTMEVNMGFNILLPLFASVILGGIGSVYGAVAGGFIVGIAMKTSVLWIGTEYELASAFIILILVMLVRPQGILGSRV